MTPVDLLADNDALKEENERLNTAYYALAEENERLRAALGAALDKDEATRVLKHRIGELKTRIDAALNVATVALLIPHYAYGDSEGGVALADALRATVRALKGEG